MLDSGPQGPELGNLVLESAVLLSGWGEHAGGPTQPALLGLLPPSGWLCFFEALNHIKRPDAHLALSAVTSLQACYDCAASRWVSFG